MKKTILFFTLIFASFFVAGTATAQVKVSINIGSQPVWGPQGYDHADYYYLPDIDAYYNVAQRKYIYMDGGKWIFATALPSRFSNFDLYKSYKVVVNQPKPYLHTAQYRKQYAQYKGRHDQPVIRDSHDQKYFQIKDHPEHSKWKGKDGHH